MALNFGKLNFAVSFNPQTAFPLDARSYFESYALALEAAGKAEEAGSTTSVYYYGQTLVVNENSKATLYIIQPDKTLKEVGSVPVGDGKSIEVVDGQIKLKGFGSGYYKYNSEVEGKYEFVENEFKAGLQPQIAASSEGTGFEIAWFEPNPTTVEGLQSEITALSSSVVTLGGKVDTNIEDIQGLDSRIKVVEEAGYATQTWVEEKGYLTDHQDISGKADKSDLEDYYTKTESDNKFMTEAQVDARVNKVITDAVDGDTLTNLTELVQYINEHGGEAAELATSVQNLENNKANKSDVYTKEEIEAKGYLTEHQSLTDYAKKDELFSGSYNDLTDKPEIPSIEGLASETFVSEKVAEVEAKIITDNKDLVNGAGYITESALEGLATEAFVSSEIVKAVTEGKVDLTGYATEQFVNEKFAQAPTTDDIDTKVNAAKSELNGSISAVQEQVTANANSIGLIQTDLQGKVNQSDLEALNVKVLANESNIGTVQAKALEVESNLNSFKSQVGEISEGSTLVADIANTYVSKEAYQGYVEEHKAIADELRSDIDSNVEQIAEIKDTTIPAALLEAKSYADDKKAEAISAAEQTLVDRLKNYSTTEEVNAAIMSAVTSAGHIKKEVVTELPESPVENIIYMIDQDGNGIYEEWTLLGDKLTKIGDTQTDLTGYAKESWVTEQVTAVQDGILVKSINTDQFEVTAEGKLNVKQISTDLLVQGSQELVLNGGKA